MHLLQRPHLCLDAKMYPAPAADIVWQCCTMIQNKWMSAYYDLQCSILCISVTVWDKDCTAMLVLPVTKVMQVIIFSSTNAWTVTVFWSVNSPEKYFVNCDNL